MRRPFTVAMTGGIASGKTTVSDCFSALGAAVIDTDLLAREVVAPGSEGLAQIEEVFGTGILASDGSLDRRRMREIVFSMPEKRALLERITHPRIGALVRQRIAAVTADYALVVVPLLVENRAGYAWVDRTLVIDVMPDTQKARLLRRDQVDEALADAMIAAQSSREQRLAIADDVICNDAGLPELRLQVAALDDQYRALASAYRVGLSKP